MKSVSEKYNDKNKNSSLKFSEFNKYHQLILDKILRQNKEVNTYDRIEDFKNWFMNNFMEIIQKKDDKQKFISFNIISFENKEIIKVDTNYYRPTEVESLLGDSSKAKKILGWEPKITFEDLVKEMVEKDLKSIS